MITRELERSAFYRQRVPKLAKQAGVFLFVCFAWIFFRAGSLGDAILIVRRIFTAPWRDPQVPVLMLLMVGLVWLYAFLYESKWREYLKRPPLRIATAVFMILYLCVFSSGGGTSSTSSSEARLQDPTMDTTMTQDKEAKPHEGLLITSEMRLSLRQWAIVLAIVTLVAVATPRLWKHVERFDTGADYRIPYQLSNDYWLFDWRLQKTADARTDRRAGRFGGVGRIREVRRNASALPQPAGRTARSVRQRRGQRAVSPGAGRIGAILRHVAARPQGDRRLQSSLAQQSQGRHAGQEGGEHQPCLARAAVLPAHPLLPGRCQRAA